MKKQLLLLIGLLCIFFSNAQKNKNDEFTYKRIDIVDQKSETLQLTGSKNNGSAISVSSKSSTNSGIGETMGNLSVSLRGGALYDIPIAVPPGINGVQPKISLNYDSQSGTNIIGYGWNISGLSVISRTPSTKFHDNAIDAVDFDALDRFSLDGQRLMLKSGTYGKNGAIYQTENYSNLKIVSYGASPYGISYGPEYFVVHYPDGSLAHYGHSTDSSSKLFYAITYWQNPQGVRISYEYTENDSRNRDNITSIWKIKYGSRNTDTPKNTIEFVYDYLQDYKRDQAYIGNVSFEQNKILKGINVYSGGVGFRNYLLTYDPTSLGFARLASLQERSGDNSLSHSAIQFSYNNSSPTINTNNITANLGLVNIEQRNAETVSLDLTGNGKMDFLVYPKPQKNKFWVFKNIQSSSTNYPYEVNTGTFEEIFPVTWLNHTNKILAGQGIGIIQNTTNNKVKLKIYSNGTTNPIYYQYEKLWSPPTYTNTYYCGATPTVNKVPQKYISGDFNGDGLSDVIAIGKPYSYTTCRSVPCDGGGDPWDPQPIQQASDSIVQKNQTNINAKRLPIPIDNGCCDCNTISINSSRVNFINLDRRITSGFSNQAGYLSGGLKSTDKLLTGDVNGDGKTDILHVTTGSISVYTLNESNNIQLLWKTSNENIRLDLPLLLGDYNGDGKTDFMTPIIYNAYSFRFFMSTGNRFITTSISPREQLFKYRNDDWDGLSGTNYTYDLIATDINGDGRTDIIDYHTITKNSSTNGTQKVYVYSNAGGGAYSTYFTSRGNVTKTGNLKHFPIPIFLSSDNPNRSLDFASISNQWVTSFSFNHDHREDVLLRSIDNNGVTYNINYNNLDPGEYGNDYTQVYQSTYSETYPNVDLKVSPGTKVVSSLQRVVSGSPTLKQIYSYYGAVYNLEGLGFRGFKGIARSNWHTSNSDRIFNVSKYDIGLRGVLIQEDSRPYSFSFSYTPSDYISKTTFTNASSLATNKVFKIWQTASVTQNALEGTVINRSYLYDSYNNPTRITTNYNGPGTNVIDITYANSTGSVYYIGRPTKEKGTTTIGGNTFSTEEQFSYSDYLLTQKRAKGHNTSFDVENYTHDVYGNITRIVTTPYNSPSREVRFEYDNSGRFLTKSYDTENLTTIYQYNTSNNTLTEEANHFGQKTKYFYDSWFRLTKITDYLGKSLNTSYNEVNHNYTVTETGDDGSGKITVFDPLKRITIEKEKNVLGQWVSKSYQYDKFDRLWKESEPYTGSSGTLWTVSEYDFYGRPKSVTSYTGKTTSFTYSNLSVTANDGTKTVTTTKNAMGTIESTTDPGGTINYTYFGNGAMKTANYNGVIISNEQDGWGRKTKTTDPSAGVYTFAYNGYGEITQQTTPKGTTDYTYSSIGKLLQEKIVGDHTNMTLQYSYHATNKKVSAISLINSDGNNTTYSYNYDNQHHRLTYTSELNPYTQFTKRLTYDAYGRVDTEENYGRLLANGKSTIKTIKNTYQYGSLKSIRDNATQVVLWNVSTLNSRGQITETTMGNNLRSKFTYNSNGYLTEMKSEKNVNTTPVELMKLTFDFDDQRGTLKMRTNSLFSWTENFTYDNFDRLVSFNDNTGSKNHTYDVQGRITQNNKLGIYNYSGKSYRLDNINLNSTGMSHYTENWAKQDITYNAFKKPVEIDHEYEDKVSFQYNAFLGRANIFYGGTQTDKLQRRYRKHYSHDGSMEISYDKTTGKTVFINYIGGDAYSAPAIWHSKHEGNIKYESYFYLYRDYLGSIIMISDKFGQIHEKRHFDAWGNIVKLQNGNGNDLSSFDILDRGYTGHEHLQSIGLIHMNGRMYDPVTHRFLAPDNFIQNPYNTQNYNRYGYVLNNPLMYTDPSGEMFGNPEMRSSEGEGSLLGWFLGGLITLGNSFFGNSSPAPARSTHPIIDPHGWGPYALGPPADHSIPPPGPQIPGAGYRLDTSGGVTQLNMIQGGSSSNAALSTGGTNDWIANGSNIDKLKTEQDADYRVNLRTSKTPIQDVFEAMHIARSKKKLDNLFDVVEPNLYGNEWIYSKKVTIEGHEYKINVATNNQAVKRSRYDIHKMGFGYLDRFTKYAPTTKWNEGYYNGFYMVGYDHDYLITIGAKTSDGFTNLRNLYYSSKK